MGNLLNYNDESVETSLGDWAVSGSGSPTLTQSTTHALDGTHSMQIVSSTSGFCGVVWNAASIPVSLGTTYTLSFWIYTTLTGRTASAEINWYDGATYLSDAANTILITANTWTNVAVQSTPAATTTACVPLALGISNAASQTFWIDEIFFGVLPDIPGGAVNPVHSTTQAVSRAHLW
jgi:FtsH-binding integral membrane protein